MRNLKTIIICCSLILLSCRIASAQIIHDSILELQQVNILKNNAKAVVPVQELKGEQLEALNSHSVADAVRFFAGVQIKDYGGVGGLKTIDVRGMGSQHVAVFYDGIQLGNAQNGIVDLGKFSLDDMEVISLYNGQKSNIFQSAKDYASASAIYLQTKKPVFIGDKKTNATLRYKLGSIQLINPSIRIEQKITDRLSAVLSAEYVKTNGVYKFRYQRKNLDGTTAYDTVLKRRDGQVDAKRLELGLIGKGNQSNWNVKGYLYDSDRGIPAAIVRGRFDGRGQTLVDRNYFVQGKYEKRFRNFQSKINAKFAYDFTHYTDTVSTVKTENKYTLPGRPQRSRSRIFSGSFDLYEFFQPIFTVQFFIQYPGQAVYSNPVLQHSVPVPQRNCFIFKRLMVNGNAIRSSNCVHPAVTLPYAVFFVVQAMVFQAEGL